MLGKEGLLWGSLLQPVGGASPEGGRGLSYKWAALAPDGGWAWCLLYLVAGALGPPPLQDPAQGCHLVARVTFLDAPVLLTNGRKRLGNKSPCFPF